MKQKIILFIVIMTLLLVSGCGSNNMKVPVSGGSEQMAVAPLINTKNEKIGEVSFVEGKDGVTIAVIAEGLPPGKKGIHIHETGVCTPPTFTSAGGHLNPAHREHGFDNPKGFHLGDLPNIEVDANGRVSAELELKDVTLEMGQKNSLLDRDGSALVIHANEDDYKTDPSGNSGDRIACAVVKAK
ncbi:superoxide dismutase family protein [Sporosarcina sp. HYO08]|uniref:superoxide dismutase family protein n=1 Tax=Sporosarcina sp. HYO08 TaxID=1759557 RepID=UPI000799F520|nr:superoxide dismutase family protein [Sporosarcina sp. HYO08]KXH80876.1 superoxide dismutase [Sporosarcina sp. HYO08]